MTHNFESWTVEQFIARRKLKRAMAWRTAIILTMVASQIGMVSSVIYSRYKREERPAVTGVFAVPTAVAGTVVTAATTSGTPSFSGIAREYHDRVCVDQAVTDPRTLRELYDAQMAWQIALGRKIRRPALLRNTCDEPCPGAIACSDSEHYSVHIVSLATADMKTVLMHEIGHLLGVPHIEGDPLMDASYKGQGLVGPTPAAIALAKLAGGEIGK